ncbi:hypothetical protein [Dyadobacter crusticola]|uniref:hypothetical protein n=1 Tax=Dyadobacter crusticola TaxID=292407 RepID=UPI0004E2040B|nr:hypothetical protein [Dyadobacter crusticola]
MIKKMKCLAMLLAFVYISAKAQDPSPRGTFAVETRLTTYLQNGFDAAVFYYPSQSKFSFGAIYATHEINGNTRSLIFESNNRDALSIRLTWLAGIISRYHFLESRKGFFGEVGVGVEEFKVHIEEQVHGKTNGFISPAVGFMWFPWKAVGLYVLPKITANVIVGRGREQRLRETTFRLRPVFPAPSIAIGWKF